MWKFFLIKKKEVWEKVISKPAEPVIIMNKKWLKKGEAVAFEFSEFGTSREAITIILLLSRERRNFPSTFLKCKRGFQFSINQEWV